MSSPRSRGFDWMRRRGRRISSEGRKAGYYCN
jgi:hypothetical protein